MAAFKLDWNDRQILAAIHGASVEGLQLGAEHLLAVSSVLAPHEEGTLERSGDMDLDPDEPAASVFYDTVYAARQHEELTWRHDQGKQAKYLEEPMNTERDVMLQLLAAPIRKTLGE